MSSGKAYFDEFASRLKMARDARRQGLLWEDPDRPAYLSGAAYLMSLKVVAYWEGGPDPESDQATGDLADVPMPERRGLTGGNDADL